MIVCFNIVCSSGDVYIASSDCVFQRFTVVAIMCCSVDMMCFPLLICLADGQAHCCCDLAHTYTYIATKNITNG